MPARDPVDEQIAYYRARAEEYDDFWSRQGDYALPADQAVRWRADADEAEAAVVDWAVAHATGEVLELAAGTGLWTRLLARSATSLTAVDASSEALALNGARLDRDGSVDLVLADVFAWRPGRRFDAVMFGYWHSHVPDERLPDFWALVDALLRPGGEVYVVDSAPWPPGSPASDAATVERRALHDGSSFSVVKRYWDPPSLVAALASYGWTADVRTTAHGMILLARAARAGDPGHPHDDHNGSA